MTTTENDGILLKTGHRIEEIVKKNSSIDPHVQDACNISHSAKIKILAVK